MVQQAELRVVVLEEVQAALEAVQREALIAGTVVAAVARAAAMATTMIRMMAAGQMMVTILAIT